MDEKTHRGGTEKHAEGRRKAQGGRRNLQGRKKKCTMGDREMQKEGPEKHTILMHTSTYKHIDMYGSAAHLKT